MTAQGVDEARAVRLYPFSAGTLTVPLQWVKNNQFADEPLVVPVPWFVITHPRGDVVIDGGPPAAAGIDDVAHWGELITLTVGMRCNMRPEEECLATLRAHGFDPARVRYILQTHLHADHVGALAALDAFPNAKVVTSRREYEYSRAPDAFFSMSYASPELDQDIDWVLIEDAEDGFDLYGDGTIRLYHTPGHSEGHMSFLVTLPESGSFVLTGDAADTEDHWRELAAPGIANSFRDAFRSVRRLWKLADQHDATVIYGHDPAQFPGEIRQAGEYYA